MQPTIEQLRLKRVQLFKQHRAITKQLIDLDIQIAKRIKLEARAISYAR